jgi:hypothetical protein
MTRYIATVLAFVLLVVVGGCKHTPYKRAYIAGAVTKEFVTEAHGIYDEQANIRLAKCDPAQNLDSKVTNKREMDECMGKGYKKDTQEKIVQALGVYNTLAIGFTAVMLGCAPNEDGSKVNAKTCAKKVYSSAELREWRGKLIASAMELLELFPEAKALTKKLNALVGR